MQLGTVNAGQNFNVTAGGSITQSGVITATGGATTLAVTAANSDILLNTQANDFGSSAWVFGGTESNIRDVAMRNINSGAVLPNFAGLSNLRNLTVNFDAAPIVFPAVTLTNSGNLVATAGGAISQTGAITVPGTTSFSAGSNAITLGGNNSFTGAVSLANSGANDVTLNNTTALVLAASSVGRNLTVTANGAITQTGALTVPGAASFSAGAHAITLTQANALSGAVSLANSGANDISIINSGALQLGTVNAGQNLNVTAGGSITQSGVITASGGTTTLAVTAANSDILLNTQANDFGSAAWVFGGTESNIRDVAMRNINAGAVLPSFAGLSNLRNLTVNFDAAPIVFPAVTLTNSGNLVATAVAQLVKPESSPYPVPQALAQAVMRLP